MQLTGGSPAVEKMANRRRSMGRGHYPPQKGRTGKMERGEE